MLAYSTWNKSQLLGNWKVFVLLLEIKLCMEPEKTEYLIG